MIIEIEPLDTLFFRDGKPFSMGEEVWADGIFPPSPSVIYGALRSAYFANHIDLIKQANKPNDPTSNLEIKGIYYRLENANYLPLPLDLVQRKARNKEEKDIKQTNQTYKLDSLVCSYDKTFYSSVNIPAILWHKEEVESLQDGIIECSQFNKYLSGETIDLECRRLSDLIAIEPKIGIGRKDNTHVAFEGKIYRVGMQRLQGLKIIVEFEGLEIEEEGFLKLGGEGKSVSYKKVEGMSFVKPNITGNRFKLYLSTPAIFENGWIPGWLNKGRNGIELKLLTAAIGRPTSIGGFDIKTKKPKPMQKVVPAGSVYYFEIEKGRQQEIIENFNQKSISEFRSKEGFGISFVAEIK